MHSRWPWCCGLLALLCVGAVAYFLWPDSPIEITRDPNPRFRIDPNQPYQIEFSRGWPISGQGETVTISQDGRVKVGRSKDRRPEYSLPGWEEATVVFPPEALATVLELIESNKIMKMHARYEHTDVMDGGSWGVVITQGERTKSVICVNCYPENWLQFEQQLRQLVSEYTKDAVWQPSKDLP